MIKWPITYTNFDDIEVTEDFYFHLSKSKLIQMVLEGETEEEMSSGGASGLGDYLGKIASSGDNAKIMATFSDLVGQAYGLRDPHNANSFIQTDELKAGFMNSPAFDALLTELLLNEASVIKFVHGVVPKDLAQHIDFNVTKQQNQPAIVQTGNGMPSQAEIDKLTGLKEPRDRTNELVPWAFRDPTDQELTAMTKVQLLDVSRRQMAGWKPQPL